MAVKGFFFALRTYRLDGALASAGFPLLFLLEGHEQRGGCLYNNMKYLGLGLVWELTKLAFIDWAEDTSHIIINHHDK